MQQKQIVKPYEALPTNICTPGRKMYLIQQGLPPVRHAAAGMTPFKSAGPHWLLVVPHVQKGICSEGGSWPIASTTLSMDCRAFAGLQEAQSSKQSLRKTHQASKRHDHSCIPNLPVSNAPKSAGTLTMSNQIYNKNAACCTSCT